MAGNVGTQSPAVTIRVLMDEQLTTKQKPMLVVKEMKIGFANGLFLGFMAWIFLGLYICVIKGISDSSRDDGFRLCWYFTCDSDGDLQHGGEH